MKIKFTKNFVETIKDVVWYKSQLFKLYDLLRYDIPRFLRNVWKFREGLWSHYWFDPHGTLVLLETGLTDICNNIEINGNEIDEARLKKVVSMRRALQLLKNKNHDSYVDIAEKELGDVISHEWEYEPSPEHLDCYQLVDKDTDEEKAHNRKVFDRAREIEVDEWNELFVLLKGQDYSKFNKEKDWNEQFDGSGLKGWWD